MWGVGYILKAFPDEDQEEMIVFLFTENNFPKVLSKEQMKRPEYSR